jgi:hypothetical protein
MCGSQVSLHYPALALHELALSVLPLPPLPLFLLLSPVGLHATLTLLLTNVALYFCMVVGLGVRGLRKGLIFRVH